MKVLSKDTIKILSTRDAQLTPGRIDTRVSADPVIDTLISDSSIEIILPFLDNLPEKDWLDLAEGSSDTSVRELALRRANEIKLIRYLIDQVMGEDDNSEAIQELEKLLYGHYSESLYYDAIYRKINQIKSLDLPFNIAGAEEARALALDSLDSCIPLEAKNSTNELLGVPTEETLKTIQKWIYDQFADVFEEIDSLDNNELNADSIKHIFDLCIDSTPALFENDWQCEIVDREKNAISVYASDKKIVVPINRKCNKEALKKLVVHELFGHALRSAMAEQRGNIIGQLGTASYQSFEESFEIALEQCLSGEYNPMRGVDHYLAIGMAFSSGKTKDEIANLFKIFSQLDSIAESQLAVSDKAIEKSKQIAVKQIRRTFAGQTDVDEGIPHMKNIDYFYGLTGAWNLLNEMVRLGIVDKGMQWLLSAKFNPFSENDRELVEATHPMPDVLAGFFRQ